MDQRMTLLSYSGLNPAVPCIFDAFLVVIMKMSCVVSWLRNMA
jgi:hypothetical protein